MASPAQLAEDPRDRLPAVHGCCVARHVSEGLRDVQGRLHPLGTPPTHHRAQAASRPAKRPRGP